MAIFIVHCPTYVYFQMSTPALFRGILLLDKITRSSFKMILFCIFQTFWLLQFLGPVFLVVPFLYIPNKANQVVQNAIIRHIILLHFSTVTIINDFARLPNVYPLLNLLEPMSKM